MNSAKLIWALRPDPRRDLSRSRGGLAGWQAEAIAGRGAGRHGGAVAAGARIASRPMSIGPRLGWMLHLDPVYGRSIWTRGG